MCKCSACDNSYPIPLPPPPPPPPFPPLSLPLPPHASPSLFPLPLPPLPLPPLPLPPLPSPLPLPPPHLSFNFIGHFFPSEIEKLGEDACEIYLEAFAAVQKMPFCTLLILGRKGAGKTSLFRQLVQKPFLKGLDQTMGIDSSTVEAVGWDDPEATSEWQLTGIENSQQKFSTALAHEFLRQFSRNQPCDEMSCSEAELLGHLKADTFIANSKLLELAEPETSAHLARPQPCPSGSRCPTESRIVPLDSRQTSAFNKIVRHSTPQGKPSLFFNVFELAGLDEYRPMHQHFISHCGLHMLVFNLPDMLQYIRNPDSAQYNPLDDLLFWVKSLHLHIQPDSEEVERVLLVGTHREELPRVSQNLEEINRFIGDNFLGGEDALLKKHIQTIGYQQHIPVGYRQFFIPVENSIDIKSGGDNYLLDSGTRLVQNYLIAMCKNLPNLAMPYPIVWLNFEEKLKRLRRQCPIVKREEARELSMQSGISDWDQYNMAMQIFHYTGRITCLGELNQDL